MPNPAHPPIGPIPSLPPDVSITFWHRHHLPYSRSGFRLVPRSPFPPSPSARCHRLVFILRAISHCQRADYAWSPCPRPLPLTAYLPATTGDLACFVPGSSLPHPHQLLPVAVSGPSLPIAIQVDLHILQYQRIWRRLPPPSPPCTLLLPHLAIAIGQLHWTDLHGNGKGMLCIHISDVF